MMPLLLRVAFSVMLQSPDGAGPAIPDPNATSAPAAPAPEASVDEDAKKRQAAGVTELTATPAPAPAAGTAPSVERKNQPAPSTAPVGSPKEAKKDKRDHWSGVFVSGVGGAVMVVGAGLGVMAFFFNLLNPPFPGGEAERAGFATSAIVGAVFCGLVGFALVTVGAALVGVSFL